MLLNNKNKKSMIIFILYLLFIFIFIASISLFWVGFHNIDLGQNLRYLNAKENINYYDNTGNGKMISGLDLYILGLNQIIIAYFLGIYSVFSLTFLTYKKGEKIC